MISEEQVRAIQRPVGEILSVFPLSTDPPSWVRLFGLRNPLDYPDHPIWKTEPDSQ